MPYLDIKGGLFEPLVILATMFHPNNIEHRIEFFVCSLVKEFLETDDKDLEFLPSTFDIKVLLNAPSYNSVYNRAMDESVKGHVAGWLLWSYAFLVKTDQDEPSLRKAKHIMKSMLNLYPTTGLKIGKTLPSLDKFWTEFRSVAHLWAALLVLQSQHENPELSEIYLLPENLDIFLGISEWFRDFGEGCFPSRILNPQSLLDPGETWKPHPDHPVEVILPEKITFPECMANALKSYKSKR